jgi:prolyl-tRNA editing enzyme YbaK/EbsC (Cys-tRNA(Pro) deacylase)
MSVPKKLINYLDKEGVKYELAEHKTVFTAWDMSQTMHVKPQQIVKTLVVKLRGKVPALVLIPAHRNLDKKKFANVAYNLTQKARKELARPERSPDSSGRVEGSREKKTSTLRQAQRDNSSIPTEWNYPSPDLKGKSYPVEFAKEKWMKEKLMGKIGATPPFGRSLKLPVFIDKALLKEKELIFNTGDYNTSIKMKAKDFAKLEQPLAGSFSMKK